MDAILKIIINSKKPLEVQEILAEDTQVWGKKANINRNDTSLTPQQ